MNKREKLVQQEFLNNEEAVIRKLKNQYSHALKEINSKSKALQDQINSLQGTLDVVTDEAAKAQLQSMIQSKVYQKQYQDALKKQIGSILDNMQVEEFKTVSEYLQQCYEDGFIGAMYDLQGQGIPLCFPMDQEAMVRAIQLDSKISEGLYTRLGEDVAVLKKKITAQISRGISTGMSFAQVAEQLKRISNIGFNNAVRIARTEGHRIQIQSAMDACYKAKDKGADVVKQWDSTLDQRTRRSHQKVDGEIRELDEPFSNGLMFPGDPSGGAGEVVNCRCALLQRARWALDEDELQTLKDRAAYFGLDKTKNFDDYISKYKVASKSGADPGNKWGFKAIQGEHSIDDDIKVSNPNFHKGHEYKVNCQRCVPTYEMRRRGYDVEAKPRITKGVDEVANNWANIFKDAQWDRTIASNRGTKTMNNIIEKMIEYGDGARGEVYVRWKGASSAHVFAVENDNGVIRFIDPQTGDRDCERYFTQIMPSKTWFLRTDNLEPSDFINGCCENKG